jgi:hypothetical protein
MNILFKFNAKPIDSRGQASHNRRVPVRHVPGRGPFEVIPVPKNLMPHLSRSVPTAPSSDFRDTTQVHQETIEWDDLVHDLRQPLSTIESLAYYLELVCADPGTRTHLKQIQKMVTEANSILEHTSVDVPC